MSWLKELWGRVPKRLCKDIFNLEKQTMICCPLDNVYLKKFLLVRIRTVIIIKEETTLLNIPHCIFDDITLGSVGMESPMELDASGRRTCVN